MKYVSADEVRSVLKSARDAVAKQTETLAETESDLQEANDTIGALEYRVRELEAECDRLHKQLKDTTEALRLAQESEAQLSLSLQRARDMRIADFRGNIEALKDDFGGKAGR